MENKTTKTSIKKEGSKKRKLIIIWAIASLSIIALGIGLGVGLSGDSGTSNNSNDPKIDNNNNTPPKKDKEEEPEVVRNNYQLIEKGEGDTNEVIVRLNENTTFDQIKVEVEQIKKDLTGKTITELRLPYGTRSEFQTTDADGNTKLDLDKIKNELGIEIEESKVGYIFYPSDETDETKTYRNQNIVEVVLPKTQKTIVRNKFYNNRIKKVNWDELVNLETIGWQSFAINDLEGDLDLSKLVKVKRIGGYSFQQNKLKGTLILPPNIEVIDEYAFTFFELDRVPGRTEQNDIHGTLKLPKSLKALHYGVFDKMSLSTLDLSEAENLETIGTRVFRQNKLSSIILTRSSLPKLVSIGSEAFRDNSEPLIKGDVEMPINLLEIGAEAFDVKEGANVYVSSNDIETNDGSFIGNVNILRYPPETTPIDIFHTNLGTTASDRSKYLKTGVTYRVIEKDNPNNTSSRTITFRARSGYGLNNTKLEVNQDEINKTNINFLEIPYAYGKEIYDALPTTLTTEESKKAEMFKQLKEQLGFPSTFDNSKIGFYLSKDEYKTDEDYQNKDLIEVSLPANIKSIPANQFKNNKIERFALSTYKELETIGDSAFENNKLKFLVFTKNSPPKLKSLGTRAFKNNDGELLTKDTELPTTLEVIGDNAIKVKNGISITTRKQSTTAPEDEIIRPDSFEGDVTFKEYT